MVCLSVLRLQVEFKLQTSPYPWEWVFIGAPEDHVHSPDEIVHKNDINAMVEMYRFLMKRL